MAPPSPIQFIETALFCTSPFALSYADPDQKWLIQKHLLSLLEDYPSFRLSTDTFHHNNGTIVNLLKASGCLHVSHSTPPIPLTIWLHENYPQKPPIVFVSTESMSPIHRNHSFVDTSGATTPTYLKTWQYPRCNLSGLVHNLVKLFTHDHPFFYSTNSRFTHPSLVSKTESLDRLVCMLHYDLVALQSKTEEEIEELAKLQAEMDKRVNITKSMVDELEKERMNLKDAAMVLAKDTDVLINWLRANDPKSVVALAGNDMEDAFEAIDDESNLVLDCLAASWGIEDLIYALDKAVGEGMVTFDTYIRQVRVLAREQFIHRAKAVKLRGPNILHWPD